MLGCHFGRCFQVTIAGGSYQEGLTTVIHGNPPGMMLTEQEIYGDLLLRKPGADELSSPRVEPDLPLACRAGCRMLSACEEWVDEPS